MWVVVDVADQTSANRVGENVARGGHERFVAAKCAIEVAGLPQSSLFLPPEGVARSLFDRLHDAMQIAGVVTAIEYQVDMVGHEAIREDVKPVSLGVPKYLASHECHD